MLHRLEQRHIVAQQTRTPQRLIAQDAQPFLVRVARRVRQLIAHRNIQHARRYDFVQLGSQAGTIAVKALLLQRVQIDNKLHVESIPDVGQRK